jgi:hypothetical protein
MVNKRLAHALLYEAYLKVYYNIHGPPTSLSMWKPHEVIDRQNIYYSGGLTSLLSLYYYDASLYTGLLRINIG